MAYIKYISYFLPEHSVTNEMLTEKFPEWTLDKISSKTGIYERPTSSIGQTSSDLALNASEKLFTEHSVDKNSIDFILLCTQSPDYFLPTTACILQDKLGLKKNIGALDYNLGCSGFIYGLALAKGLIDSGIAINILLITSETYTKYIHPKDKSNLSIFGDAASASLICKDNVGGKIDNFIFGTDGSGYENLIVKQGGMRFPTTNESNDFIDDFGNVRNEKNLYMNGPAIFNFTLETIPYLVNDILEVNNLTPKHIDLYVFHQANLYLLNHLRKKINIPENDFFIHLKKCANTVSSTIPIALSEAFKEEKIKPGDKVLLAGFGVGYSWGGCILSY
jgi:3-oxoacyl-[acyl-carrier-protein] synthase-3